MSIKVYNGFRLTKMNISEICNLMNSIKQDIYNKNKEELIKNFIQYRFELIDSILLNRKSHTKDILWRLYFDLKDKDYDNFRFVDDLEKDLLNLYKVLCKNDTAYRQVDFDKSCNINLYPIKENKILGLFLSEDISYLEKMIKKNTKVFDYHYQNSTDRPSNISYRLWKVRYKDWINTINYNNDEYLFFPIFDNYEQIDILQKIFKDFQQKNILTKYFKNFSHKERFYDIARNKFLDILVNKYIRINQNPNDDKQNTYQYMRASREAREFYNENKDYCEKRINKLKNYYLSKINNKEQNLLNYFYDDIKEVNNEQ